MKNRIIHYQNSSPILTFDSIDQIIKDTTKVMYENVLLRIKLKRVSDTNDKLSKRRQTKKRRIREGGSLTLQDSQDL
jgi:hypothetical protein